MNAGPPEPRAYRPPESPAAAEPFAAECDVLRLAAVLAPRLEAALAAAPPRDRVATADERAGTPASPDLRARLAQDLRQDEAELVTRSCRATLRALAEEAVDVATAVDRILQALDGLLAAGDVAGAGRAVGALHLEGREAASLAVVEASAILAGALADPERLSRLFVLTSPGGGAAPEDASRWLFALEPPAIPALLDLLEGLGAAEQRAVILEALALLGREEPAPIVARLTGAGPALAHDLLRLIDRIEPPNRVELLARSLRHPSPEVRREVLHALARLRTDVARAPVAAALDDPSPEVRAEAARLLVRFGPERALQDLLRTIRAPSFEDRRAAERTAFFLAVGTTGLPGALGFYREVLDHRSLLGRARGREAKLLAIAGLAASPSIGGFRLLQAARCDADETVSAAAAAAAARMRTALVGAGEDE